MISKRLLATRGIHYFVTRFGWRKLKALAFDAKYCDGTWNSHGDGSGELPKIIKYRINKGDLLIMGCGSASILEGLADADLNSALGIDLSDEAIRLASRFSSSRVSFLVSDMEAFACPHPYDIILFSESLNYVPTSKQVSLLKYLTGNLKTNGVCIVTIAEATRYEDILRRIRENFHILDDRKFLGSSRHLIIFDSIISTGETRAEGS